jgi:hypothetical protein
MVTQNKGLLLSIAAVALWAVAGCTNEQPAAPPTSSASQGHDEQGHAEHGHGAEGPHHGHLIELGDEAYHGELLHDEQAGTITIYILDGPAKREVPVNEDAVVLNLLLDGSPRQVPLTARPTASDPAGQASRFELLDPEISEAIDQQQARARLRVTIGGKSYQGAITPHAH